MPAPNRILLIEDEPAVRETLRTGLEFEGYTVAAAADGDTGLREAARVAPDLVIMDVMMPTLDGLTACRRLRARDPAIPIMMLTARDTVGDRVTGLDAGADDYLTKPFDFDELLAHIRALLRRAALLGGEPMTRTAKNLRYEDLEIDPLTRQVRRGDKALELTPTEYELLTAFLRHPRQVLTREQLIGAIWGPGLGSASNPIDVYVMYLRRKTEQSGLPRLIQTVRGVGYALRAETP